MSWAWIPLGRLRGVPIRLHLTAFVVPFVLARGIPDPWFVAEYFAIVLLHEFGHAVVAWARGVRVIEIRMHGLGGECEHEGGRAIDMQAIAWGGVLAQAWLGLALATLLRLADAGWVPLDLGAIRELESVAFWNLSLAVLNLLPIPPLDGATAWKLPQTLWRGISVETGAPTKEPVGIDGASASASDDPESIAVSVAARALDDAKQAARGREREG